MESTPAAPSPAYAGSVQGRKNFMCCLGSQCGSVLSNKTKRAAQYFWSSALRHHTAGFMPCGHFACCIAYETEDASGRVVRYEACTSRHRCQGGGPLKLDELLKDAAFQRLTPPKRPREEV